jgi:hypothetical protein
MRTAALLASAAAAALAAGQHAGVRRNGTGRALRIHFWTIPAHGHYMTLRDVAVGAARAGHDATLVMCDRNREVYDSDGLPAAGVGFLSAGRCASFDGYDAVMSRLLREGENGDTLGALFDGASRLPGVGKGGGGGGVRCVITPKITVP